MEEVLLNYEYDSIIMQIKKLNKMLLKAGKQPISGLIRGRGRKAQLEFIEGGISLAVKAE